MERGIHLYQMGDYDTAIAEFIQLISILSQDTEVIENRKLLSEAHKKLALSYARKGKKSSANKDSWYEKAKNEINKSISIFPDNKKMDIFDMLNENIMD
tara:strand:+ start:314 stop:610 length:297 start_codon:yes stop_codon:yes gene_type:complete